MSKEEKRAVTVEDDRIEFSDWEFGTDPDTRSFIKKIQVEAAKVVVDQIREDINGGDAHPNVVDMDTNPGLYFCIFQYQFGIQVSLSAAFDLIAPGDTSVENLRSFSSFLRSYADKINDIADEQAELERTYNSSFRR